MIDREKVIDELKEGIDFAIHRCHCGLGVTMEMALALLKAQEPVKPDYSPYYQEWYCGNCGKTIARAYDFCNHCGRKVEWDA